MNTLASFGIELVLTLLVSCLLVVYARPYLYRVLLDLCGTNDRASFWSVFSCMLLLGLPIVSALGYHPYTSHLDDSLLDIARQLGQDLVAFLVALIGIGLMVSFFALVAPRARSEKAS